MSHTTGSNGTGLARIVIARLENPDSYPRYFSAEVRIGVSKDAEEVKNCTRDSFNGTPVPKMINGEAWISYSLDDAAMQQYM